MVPSRVTRAVVRERDRMELAGALPGEGYRLVADVFTEIGARGAITTWRLDIRKPRDSTERQPWRIVDQERLSSIEGLHRLALRADQQFTVRDLVITSVDYELRLPAGDAFTAETGDGTTALVLLGDGTMSFAPKPRRNGTRFDCSPAPRRSSSPFTAAFVRVNPLDFEPIKAALTPATTQDPRAFRRAETIFDEEVSKSFSLDLSDLSRENWSLLPQVGDFLAEVRTRRFNTLTYARSLGEAEDVTLFHRQRKRNIAAYASEMKASSRGRFYNEDDLTEYDITDYAIDAAFFPERGWLDGQVRLRLRIKAFALGALTLRLAEEFTVQSITSNELGRLMFLRVRNQNSVVVNLPSAVSRDVLLTLNIVYAGRIQTQTIDQEGLVVQGGQDRSQRGEEMPFIPAEPNWLFSNRSAWYPQGQVSDYATGLIRFSVPMEYTVVASGVPAAGSPTRAPGGTAAEPRVTYVYTAGDPLRYFGVMVSKFYRADAATVALDVKPQPRSRRRRRTGRWSPSIGLRNTVALAVEANRRQQERGRDIIGTAAEILRLYASIVGDAPYDAMTIAMVEHDKPGGHSPGYFAVLNNPLPVTPFQFRNDPAVFTGFPEFYVAHELAHQWWGQAVGWKNYHEQWLSEGFAQYFAALYAKERRGDQAFRDVLRQFRRWAMDQSDQGAVYLGYRLGHIKGDSRVFRALVYNKGAVGAAHAAAPRRRRGVLPRSAPLLRREPLQEGGHRRSAARDGSRVRRLARSVLRTLDLRVGSAAHPLLDRRRGTGTGRPLRADRRRLRRAGHGHAAVSRQVRPTARRALRGRGREAHSADGHAARRRDQRRQRGAGLVRAPLRISQIRARLSADYADFEEGNTRLILRDSKRVSTARAPCITEPFVRPSGSVPRRPVD